MDFDGFVPLAFHLTKICYILEQNPAVVFFSEIQYSAAKRWGNIGNNNNS